MKDKVSKATTMKNCLAFESEWRCFL
jgi:hypothetical protein